MQAKLLNILMLFSFMRCSFQDDEEVVELDYKVLYKTPNNVLVPSENAGISISHGPGLKITLCGTGKANGVKFPYEKNGSLIIQLNDSRDYTLFDIFYDGTLLKLQSTLEQDSLTLEFLKDTPQFVAELNIPEYQKVDALISTPTNEYEVLNTSVPVSQYQGFNNYINGAVTPNSDPTTFKPEILLALNVISNRFFSISFKEAKIDDDISVFIQSEPGFGEEVREDTERHLKCFLKGFVDCFVRPNEKMAIGIRNIRRQLLRQQAKAQYIEIIKNRKCHQTQKPNVCEEGEEKCDKPCPENGHSHPAVEYVEGYNQCLRISKVIELVVNNNVQCCSFNSSKFQNICESPKRYPITVLKAVSLLLFDKEFCNKMSTFKGPEVEVLVISDFSQFLSREYDTSLAKIVDEVCMLGVELEKESEVDLEVAKIAKKKADDKEKAAKKKKPVEKKKDEGSSTGKIIVIVVVCVVVGGGVCSAIGYGIYTMT